MGSPYALSLLLACILITSCAVPPRTPEVAPPAFTFTTEGEGNELTVSIEDKVAIIDVHSPRGIGSAEVDLVAGAFPESLVLRMHTKGLEKFTLSYNETKITASVSSSDSRVVMQSLASPEGGESPIGLGSPSWLEISIVSDQATPEIPLTQGYFEITLPEGLSTEADRSFSIQWIDFYR